jgi:hypothetical protein
VVAALKRAADLHHGLIYPDGYEYLLMAAGIAAHLQPTIRLGGGGQLFVPTVDASLKPLFPALVAAVSAIWPLRQAADIVMVASGAAATVLAFPNTALTGGLNATNTASGGWPAVALGGLLAVVVLALGLAGRRLGVAALPVAEAAPFFTPHWRSIPDRLGTVADALEVPAEFRVTGWKQIDDALTRCSIWLWIVLFAVLAIVVTR